jgi:uncharacterized protein YjiS (DUF1127 family)
MTIAHTRSTRQQVHPKSFFSALKQRLRQRRELRALLSQPDYLLKDIGVEKHQIMREVSKPFWLA